MRKFLYLKNDDPKPGGGGNPNPNPPDEEPGQEPPKP